MGVRTNPVKEPFLSWALQNKKVFKGQKRKKWHHWLGQLVITGTGHQSYTGYEGREGHREGWQGY